jgi:hypothetical protein
VNECTVAPTPAPQCFIKLYTSSSSRNLQVYAEAFLNSNSAWSNRTALDFVGLYKGAMEVSSIPVFEVPAAIRLSVDDGSKEWGYWKVPPAASTTERFRGWGVGASSSRLTGEMSITAALTD